MAGVLGVLGAGALVPTADAAPPPATGQRYIVRFAASAADPDTEAAAAVHGNGGQVHAVLHHVFSGAVLDLPEQAVENLRRNPNVASIEPDQLVTAAEVQPGATWGLDRVDQRALPLSGTYTYPASGAGVTAYVVDSGIRADHADLSGRVRSGFDAVGDGNGTSDCNGHGTHVAGTIGGEAYGVAKDVALVAVRVLGCDNTGSLSGILTGLDWVAADHAAGTPAVLNMSVTGPATATVDAAVDTLVADGVTVVVAAGNNAVDACTSSPARAAAAITVGATDAADVRASFSNVGACVDVFAPGVSITSDGIASTTATATMSGTSMASPHVAGAAAVLLAGQPSLSPADVAGRLLTGATAGVVGNAGVGSPNRLLFSDPGTTTPPAPAPATAPARPTNVVATPGPGSATVTWVQGANGGSTLTAHTIRIYSGRRVLRTVTVAGTATSAAVTGLDAGKGYSFTVVATNAVGSSPESLQSNVVYPTRAPSTGGGKPPRK